VLRAFTLSLTLLTVATGQAPSDPLPSWNDSVSKKAILDFVGRVTRTGGPDFVPAAERIAVFDNDGTLWSEQPMYVQVLFAFDRVHELAPTHPEWKNQQPFKGVLERDMKAVAATGEKGLLQIPHWKSSSGARRSAEAGLGARGHETGLDGDPSLREVSACIQFSLRSHGRSLPVAAETCLTPRRRSRNRPGCRSSA
jgi:hypothetical protein